jgi:hypothetical protein
MEVAHSSESVLSLRMNSSDLNVSFVFFRTAGLLVGMILMYRLVPKKGSSLSQTAGHGHSDSTLHSDGGLGVKRGWPVLSAFSRPGYECSSSRSFDAAYFIPHSTPHQLERGLSTFEHVSVVPRCSIITPHIRQYRE